MEFTLNQIASLIGGKVEGDGTLKVRHLDKIQEGLPGGISFLSNEKYESYIYSTESTAVIVSDTFQPNKPLKTNLIRVKNPYEGFTLLLEAYASILKSEKTGIEEPSFFDPTSTIGEKFYRGAFSYVGKNCEIGKSVKIYPNAYIGDNVKIGHDTIVHAGVKIYNNTIIGEKCEIHAGAVIGGDGFGFAPIEDGTFKSIPQLGNVVIGDQVSIGCNTTIDCATMGSTVIENGVKIDNLVQIAHNVSIGENTVIASQAGVSGSTEIGKNCIIAGQAGIVGHLKIVDGTTIGASTGVTKNITKPGQTIFGYMGIDLKDFLKSYSLFKKLPELHQRIKELEKKL